MDTSASGVLIMLISSLFYKDIFELEKWLIRVTTITPSIDAYFTLELENSIGDWKNLEPMLQSERAFLLF